MVALDEAISLFATAAIAVREVFQIDSSVRLTAIEHLGKYFKHIRISSRFTCIDTLTDHDF